VGGLSATARRRTGKRADSLLSRFILDEDEYEEEVREGGERR
jgi:hypothetical protein